MVQEDTVQGVEGQGDMSCTLDSVTVSPEVSLLSKPIYGLQIRLQPTYSKPCGLVGILRGQTHLLQATQLFIDTDMCVCAILQMS